MTGFHRWMSTDGEGEDSCQGCGVVTPDFGDDVSSDHGPLPLFCPEPKPFNAHHFQADPAGISCAYCTVTITDETLPADVDWECRAPERPEIPADHPNFRVTCTQEGD